MLAIGASCLLAGPHGLPGPGYLPPLGLPLLAKVVSVITLRGVST